MVGRKTVERFGWKIGDRVPLQAPVWRNKTGGSAWEFTIRAIYEAREKGFDETNMFFHYDYFDEARFFGEGLVGWYILRIDDPQRAAEIAERIDALYDDRALCRRLGTLALQEVREKASWPKAVAALTATLD